MTTPQESAREAAEVSPAAEWNDDGELLRRFVTDREEAAFRELVRRHLDFVYSAARRRLGGDAHSAADIAQQVFTALARHAARLPPKVLLPAWLYGTTRRLSANFVRAEHSRRAREQAAHLMNEINAPVSSACEWERLRPLLDTVIDDLCERDRGAIVLRYFAQRSFADIGAQLHVTEDAARMRVERALEKMRAALARRGVVSTSSALGGLLTHHAVTAAPAGMVVTVASLALQSGPAVFSFFAFMTSTKFIVGAAAAIMIAGATGLVWPTSRAASSLTDRDAPAVAPASPTIIAQSASAVVRSPAERIEFSGPVTVETLTAAESKRNELPTGARLVAAVTQRRVEKLDTLVGLSPEQKARVADVFMREHTVLETFSPEERGTKGMDARRTSRREVRDALTAEQQQKYDISPQSLGGGLAVDPASMVSRLDQTVKLTTEQKKKAEEILWDDVMNQMAALPASEQLRGFLWRDAVRDRLRAILTREQLTTFDTTPPYRKNR